MVQARLVQAVTPLVHADQCGFLPNRSAAEAVLRTQDVYDRVTHRFHRDGTTGAALVFVDFSDAFGSLSQQWVDKLTAKAGLGGKMRRRIAALNKDTTLCVNVRGTLSRRFCPQRGQKQGGSCSPLLFALAVEPLARLLRRNVKGVPLAGGLPDVLALFADDLTVFPSCRQDLIELHKALVLFRKATGIAVNPSKTRVLLVGAWREEGAWQALAEDVPWLRDADTSDQAAKLLGAYVGQRQEVQRKAIKAMQANLHLARRAFSTTGFVSHVGRQEWLITPLGRALLARVLMAPRVHHLAEVAVLSTEQWNALQTTVDAFVRAGTEHSPVALSSSVLRAHPDAGGLGVPVLELRKDAQRVMLLKKMMMAAGRDLRWAATWGGLCDQVVATLEEHRHTHRSYLKWHPNQHPLRVAASLGSIERADLATAVRRAVVSRGFNPLYQEVFRALGLLDGGPVDQVANDAVQVPADDPAATPSVGNTGFQRRAPRSTTPPTLLGPPPLFRLLTSGSGTLTTPWWTTGWVPAP
eukprot:m.465347 g.465347  ORF g.465347 m.465347 type:complete len:525 (+) comp20361_c3_seq1:2401-3975(+)